MSKKLFSVFTLALILFGIHHTSAETLVINGSPQIRKPEKITIESNGEIDNTFFSYDKSGQLVKVTTDYSTTSIDWSKRYNIIENKGYYGEVSMEFKSSTTTFRTVFELDSNWRAYKAVTSNDDEVLATHYFTYNSDGFLTKIKEEITQNGKNLPTTECSLYYYNGGYGTLYFNSADFLSSCSYQNGVMMENVEFNLNSLFWPAEFASYVTIEYGSYIGLLGKTIHNYPRGGFQGEGPIGGSEDDIEATQLDFGYEFQNLGFPRSITVTPGNEPSVKVSFVWEK